MDVLPTGEQEGLLLGHDAHGAANFAAAHGVGPDQCGDAIAPEQVDLGLAITEGGLG